MYTNTNGDPILVIYHNKYQPENISRSSLPPPPLIPPVFLLVLFVARLLGEIDRQSTFSFLPRTDISSQLSTTHAHTPLLFCPPLPLFLFTHSNHHSRLPFLTFVPSLITSILSQLFLFLLSPLFLLHPSLPSKNNFNNTSHGQHISRSRRPARHARIPTHYRRQHHGRPEPH